MFTQYHSFEVLSINDITKDINRGVDGSLFCVECERLFKPLFYTFSFFIEISATLTGLPLFPLFPGGPASPGVPGSPGGPGGPSMISTSTSGSGSSTPGSIPGSLVSPESPGSSVLRADAVGAISVVISVHIGISEFRRYLSDMLGTTHYGY